MTTATLALVVVVRLTPAAVLLAVMAEMSDAIDEADEAEAEVMLWAEETAEAEPPVTGNWPE